jgi:sterol desaturase/sphingolipid hydroxylase (fatty acid hydroxylase superfamily)
LDSLIASFKNLLGSTGSEVASFLYWQVFHPLIAPGSLHWVFITSTVVVAWLYFAARASDEGNGLRGFARFLFPRAVWAHPSAVVDYKFFFVNQVLMANVRMGTWIVGLAGLLYVREDMQWLLGLVLTPGDPQRKPGLLAMVAFTIAMGVAFDYARYLSHRLHHRFAILWEFHKVHHSAEVLTPFTNYRNHPVETVVELFLRVIITAAVSGTFGFFYPAGVVEYTVLNYGALTAFFYLTAHLRHSHVPLDFGPLRTILISPRMHHVHHSAVQAHFDKNFGFLFAFWDRLGGTLYLPHKDETFDLGLPPEAGRFDSAWNLYIEPFRSCYRMLKARFAPDVAGQ